MKQTPNTELPTPNAELQTAPSAFDVRRSTLSASPARTVRRFPPTQIVLRILALIIGGLFIYAGILKIIEPVQFARDIDNYKMLPWPVAVGLAFFLPWLEVFCGVALIMRRLCRGGLLILIGLTIVFIVASIIAKSRGLDITCGCFGHASAGWSFAKHMVLDFAILASLVVLWLGRNTMARERQMAATDSVVV